MKEYGSFAICYHQKTPNCYGWEKHYDFLHHYYYGPEVGAKEEIERLNSEHPEFWTNGSYKEKIEWDNIEYFFYKEQEPPSFN